MYSFHNGTTFKSGIIFNIQRFSLHDGPGVRTTVFMKGCNLRCAWCHNPESFEMAPQKSVDTSKCIGCGACAQCSDICPTDARKIIGRSYTVHEVLDVVLKDKAYYRNTGGVTFSGGEPTVQYEFLMALLRQSKAHGLHTCLETNGIVCQEKLQTICQYVDLFLLDYKHSNDQIHIKYTGASNQQMHKSLELLGQQGKEIILRCPIIPTINDNDEHFAAIRQLQRRHNAIREVELMPYHDYGVAKWGNIGLSYSMPHVPVPREDVTNDLL